MDFCEIITKIFCFMTRKGQFIGRDVVKDAHDFGGSRMAGVTVFGIQGNGRDVPVCHLIANLTFDQGLDHQGNEEGEHGGFNPFKFFEQKRHAMMNMLELLKAFL